MQDTLTAAINTESFSSRNESSIRIEKESCVVTYPTGRPRSPRLISFHRISIRNRRLEINCCLKPATDSNLTADEFARSPVRSRSGLGGWTFPLLPSPPSDGQSSPSSPNLFHAWKSLHHSPNVILRLNRPPLCH